MKTLHSKLFDSITCCKRIVTVAAVIFSGVLTSSGSVTVQGWWRGGEGGGVEVDSSGNGRNFSEAFSQNGQGSYGGVPGAGIIAPGCGGPLGTTGAVSTECLFWTPGNDDAAGMWGPGNSSDPVGGYNPPGSNYVIECYILPVGTGTWNNGTTCHFFNSGANDFAQPSRSPGAGPGGVYFCVSNSINGDTNQVLIGAWVVANAGEGVPNDVQIGTYVPADTNNWMHVAVVNDNGTNTFYVNGVVNGFTTANTIPNGNICAGTDTQGTQPTYDGYLDEMRISTFASGAFTTNDLLLRPPGPNIVTQPQSDVVWDGGAAPFAVTVATAAGLTYQWQLDGADIDNATNSSYVFPVATADDSGSNFQCIVTLGSLSATSTLATMTVVSNNAADVAAYRSAVTAEPSLLAYFPVDNCTGSVVTNTVDAVHNGALEANANYDGRTNRSFGQRALSFNFDSVVEVPNDTAYEFDNGFGTIEALIYLSQAPSQTATIFSENYDQDAVYYSLSVDTAGNGLIYSNDLITPLSWPVPDGLVGQFVEIDLVIDNGTNVTPYVNGNPLETLHQASFGSLAGGSFWLGGRGTQDTSERWGGTIDEVAIYGTNLTAAEIQNHYTKFVFGTNQVPPVLVSQSGSRALLAGGSPVLTATVTGGLPLYYQWTFNNIPIAGATSSTLVLSGTTTNSSGSYSLTVSNVFGSTNTQPIVLAFAAPPPGYATTVMHDDPTAYWRLAETAGPTAVDSAGYNDADYNATGVTYSSGGPPFDPTAAALFDGSSGRAVTPDNYPDINPDGPFTIEFWATISSYAFMNPISSLVRPARSAGYEFYLDGNYPGYEFHTGADGGYNMITGDNNVPADGTWTYVTGVWDTTNMYLYVNGALGDNSAVAGDGEPPGIDNYEAEGASPFLPNTSQAFYIGSRSDNSHYWVGKIADVAFYNYALTYQQITNHWSAIWSPATVLAPPDVTNVEGSTVTLSATVTGLPNTYQWFFGTTALTQATNLDGTLKYPDGVSGSTLEIAETHPSDSGQYFLAITNPIGDAVSSNVTVVITPNTVPPAVAAVFPLGTPNIGGGPTPYLVKVVFTGRVDPTTGGNAANYSFSPHLTINSMTLLDSGPNDDAAASLGADWREAILDVSTLVAGQQYSLTISGVKDQSQTPLTMPTSTNYFRGATLTPGVVNWDYYYLGASTPNTTQPSTVQNDPNYPNAPMTNSFFTEFDSHQITGGTLSDNPTFGALGDNYGDVVSGWLTPTVSGSYTFFLDSDDGSILNLSSDSTVANLSQIVQNPNCCTGFLEPTNNTVVDAGGLGYYVSAPVSLTAGQSYFIETIHAQGGGGDYVRVAWRISTDNTPAADLTPIPGAYLSSYQSLPPPQFGTAGLTNGIFTLNWSGGTIQQSTDLLNWTNVPGNPSPLVVPVNSTTNELFFRLIEP